jgi:hypothetical protein
LPGFQHVTDRIQQFLVERLVLAFQIQHGHRLGGLRWSAAGRQCFLHQLILPAAQGAGYPQANRRIKRRAKQEWGEGTGSGYSGVVEISGVEGVWKRFALLSSDGSDV